MTTVKCKMADLGIPVDGLSNQEAVDVDQKDKLSKSFYQVLFQLENNNYINFEEKVAVLITVWRSLAKLANHLQEVPEIYMFILQESSQVILSRHWANLSTTTKRCMAKMLIYASQTVYPLIRGSTLMCAAALVMAIYDPWGDPTLKKALAGEDDLEETAVLEYFMTEPVELFGFRIELLIKEDHEDKALTFCYWCLSRIRRITASHKITDNSTALDESGVLKIIAKLEILFLSWIILLLHRKEQLHDIVKETSKCTCHQGVQLIHSMKSKRLSNVTAVSEILIHLFLVQDLMHPSSYCCTMELMNLWCEMQIQQHRSDDDVKQSSYRLLVQYASTSAHFYLFVDCLWEKFGSKFLPLYLELYLHGLTGDLNHLDVARQSDDRDAVIEMESHLANIFTKLSSLFASHVTIAQECVLSAFSLEPTKERLELIQKLRRKITAASQLSDKQKCSVDVTLKGRNVEQRKECRCEGRCSTPENARQGDRRYFNHPVLDAEIPGITEDQLSDFVMVLESVRIHYLKFPSNQEELKRVCEDYLETASALRTLFTHTTYCGNADSETDSGSENHLLANSERLSCANGKESLEKSSLASSPDVLEKTLAPKTPEKLNTKLPFDLLDRIHSTVYSKCKANNLRRHGSKENGKKKCKLSKKSRLKEIQKRKKKKKRKLKKEKDNETATKSKTENDCQEVQKIKKKKKKTHKKVKSKPNKQNALQSAETRMGSLELAAMISNNAGILFSKFHANFALSSKFCENTSLLNSCLQNPINPVIVLSDILSHKPVAAKKSQKSPSHNKKLKKNKLKLKSKHKLAKLKKKHNKNKKKFHKNKDATKKHITSGSMITSGTELSQNSNRTLPQDNAKLLTNCLSTEGSSVDNITTAENISKNTPKATTTCNITSTHQTCSPTLFQTMPILIPASIPQQTVPDSSAVSPPLMNEPSKDANKYYLSNVVTENITHLNSVNKNVQALSSIKEPTRNMANNISTCVLVERRHTAVVSNVVTPTSSYQTTTMSTQVFQTVCSSAETRPLSHTVITGKIPNQTVILPSSTQAAISVAKYPELLQKPPDGVQNVPTVATLTIPIAPSQQNGAGNRVVAGRLVIPVSLNCAGVKNVFPSSALVQNRAPTPNNNSQQAMTFPGVIIVRSNNPSSKEVNRGKVFFPPSVSKGKKPIQPIWKNRSVESHKRSYQEVSSRRTVQLPIKSNNSNKRHPTSLASRAKANIYMSASASSQLKLSQQMISQKSSTAVTSVTTFPTVTSYLQTTSIATLVSSKPYYSTAELSNTLISVNNTSMTPMCSPSEHSHTTKKQQSWSGLGVNTQTTEAAKPVQVEDSLIPAVTNSTITTDTHTVSTPQTTVVSPSLAASQSVLQVQYAKSDGKLNSAAEATYQQIISTENSDATRNEAMDNGLLLMDQPNRSLSSISDAVRVSLMVMDDETEGTESQNIQPYTYNPSDAIGYVSQENSRPLCSDFVPENIQMQQSSLLMNNNQSSQLYPPVSSCQIITNYTQQASTSTTNWSNAIKEAEETVQSKSCRSNLTNEDNTEESKKQKKDTAKKAKDGSHSSQSSASNRFWCKLCQRGFFSAYNLRRHCKNVHKMELPPTRPLVEPHCINAKVEVQLHDRQCHKQANSQLEMPQPSTSMKSFSSCSRPQQHEGNPLSQNESSSIMQSVVTDLSCSKHSLKNGVSENCASKTKKGVVYDSDQSSNCVTSSFNSQSHSSPKKKASTSKQQASPHFTLLTSQSNLPSFQGGSEEAHVRSQQTTVTSSSSFVQNITSSTQAATLSSGTNDSLEDLEQFLIENLSWGGDPSAAQNNSMHHERSGSADSLSLPVNLSSNVKAASKSTEKPVAIDYSAKSECKTVKCQSDNANACSNSTEVNLSKEVTSCPSKSAEEDRDEQITSSSKKQKESSDNQVSLLTASEKNTETTRKSKKPESLHKDQPLQMQNIDKILDLGKLSMCDEPESNINENNSCDKITKLSNEQNCQQQQTSEENCGMNNCKKLTAENVKETLQEQDKNSHEELELQSDSLNDNSRGLDVSRNGSPSALSDISHMLNECRLEISPPCKTEEPSKLKNMTTMEKVSSFLSCDESCRSFQDEMQDSTESETGKDGLGDQNSALARAETYHCKWENEHYDPEADPARGRTRSRESGKMLKRFCQCCEDSNLISRKCRKNSGSSSGSANINISKIIRNSVKRSKQLHYVSKNKTLHCRSSQRPRTRSTTIS